jgi:mannosyl-glycoprotein endo-beta-N-acetylglucosaminidase
MLRILSSEHNLDKAAKNLAKIAYFYNFDGWLVNIENGIPRKFVDEMVRFTQLLTDEMRRLKGGKSVVLWYDAVTTNGSLVWQNELNDLNK